MRVKLVKLAGLVTIFVSALWISAASAGQKAVFPVVVTPPSGMASGSISGSIGSARNSLDATQFIIVFELGGTALVVGQDNTGLSTSCVSNIPNDVDVLRNLSDSAFVSAVVSPLGLCTNISVLEGSIVEPPL